MRNEDDLWSIIDTTKAEFIALSDRVWATPELLFGEYCSAAEHVAMLKAHGFRVTENVAGIPTAVMGETGEGGPVIAILGEYDALPGLGQRGGVAYPDPLPGNGHGCGHNLLGAGSMLAAAAIGEWLRRNRVPGRVRYYGCPAEEGGAGKTYMVRAGAFEDVDAAICWHPATFTYINHDGALSNTRVDFTFHGRAAHASSEPHLGRSALDAVELMNVGVNYLREHVPPDSRLHYALLDAGGSAPNVVQARATVRYAIRSRDNVELQSLKSRVEKVAQGAALMTETKLDIGIFSAFSNLLENAALKRAMSRNMTSLGPVVFDDGDRAFASEIQRTFEPAHITTDYRRVGVEEVPDRALCDFVVPFEVRGEPMIGSTDLGDVSWAVPTVEVQVATWAIGTPGHSWQATAQGTTAMAHKGMVHAAKYMAMTARDLIADKVLIGEVVHEHREKLRHRPYVCPMPEDVQPVIPPRPENA